MKTALRMADLIPDPNPGNEHFVLLPIGLVTIFRAKGERSGKGQDLIAQRPRAIWNVRSLCLAPKSRRSSTGH
jgi:hypothetical protein